MARKVKLHRSSKKRTVQALLDKIGPYVAPDRKSIRILRDTMRMTQTMFARQFNVSLDCVKQWESGRRKPSLELGRRLRQLADMNGINIDLMADKTELKVFSEKEKTA